MSEEDKSVRVDLDIPADMAEKLEQIAAANDRTIDGEIRQLIRRHVAPKRRAPGYLGQTSNATDMLRRKQA